MRHGYLKNVIPTAERDTKRGKTSYLDVGADIPGTGDNLIITALEPQILDGVFKELGLAVIEVIDHPRFPFNSFDGYKPMSSQ